MDLSIIIVSHNVRDFLEACLRSVYDDDHKISFEVFVVDNASTDGSAEMVREAFPHVNLIANEENIGFSKANNMAIKKSQGRYVLILNPDTSVLPNTLDTLCGFMDRRPEASALGCKIVNQDGDLLPSCNNFPSFIRIFFQSFFFDQLFMRLRFLDRFSIATSDHETVHEVDWVTGACILVRKEMIVDAGYMDEGFFLYYEDVDWCRRIKEVGGTVFFTPDAQILHLGEHAFTSAWAVRESYRSLYYYIRKHHEDTAHLFEWLIRMGLLLRIATFGVGKIVLRKENIASKLEGYKEAIKLKPLRIGFDGSAIVRSRTGVGKYSKSLWDKLRRIDGRISFLLLNGKSSPRIMRNKFILALGFFIQDQLILPLGLFLRRVSLLHSPAFVSPLIKVCPYVVTVHDVSFILYPTDFTKVYLFYLKTLTPLSIKRCDLIIADSFYSKRKIIEYFGAPEEKIKVVYAGVSDLFKPIDDKEALKNVRLKYNLPNKVILYVGGLQKRKNLPTLLEAFRKLVTEYEVEHKLVIVGMDQYYSALIEAVAKLGLQEHVHFTGFVAEEDLSPLYNVADLFVFPSLYEGFGLPPLEAMACGTPVVSSNASSLPEVIGDAGILVDPLDVDFLVEKMYEVLTNESLKNELIGKGFERVKKFTWEKCAKETMKVYEDVLNKNFQH